MKNLLKAPMWTLVSMKLLNNDLFLYLQERNKYSLYLAVFRIFLCLHLLKRVILIWNNLDLLCNINNFVVKIPLTLEIFNIDSNLLRDNYKLFIGVYVIILIFYFFGIGKYLTAILVFIFTQVFQQLISLTLNGGDNILSFILMYMMFADSYNYFVIEKIKIKNNQLKDIINFMSNISVYSIIFHLCLAYFISGIFKLHSDVWFNGVAVYYTLNLERFMGTSWNSLISKNDFIVVLSTYFVLFFELYFPVLVFFKKIKIYILILGILMHLGIYIFMMIYDFQTVFIMLYGFFFTDTELKNIFNKLKKHLYIY